MLAHVAGIVFPVFALLALGAALRRSGFLSPKFAGELNKLVFYGALPCLLVDSIRRADPEAGSGASALALALATLATFAVAWLAAVPCGVPRASRATFCQTVFRSNNAYVGIPVMALALAGTPDEAHGLAVATLTLAPCLLLYNALGVAVLTKPGAGESRARRMLDVALGIARNPLILGCLCGLALLALKNRAGVVPPRPVAETVRIFGTMATPGSLVALGASLDLGRVRACLRGACAAAVVKLAVCPLIGAAICAALDLPPLHRFVVVTYLSCPSAVASFVMAEAMGGDAPLAAASVALTTVLSVFSLSATILLFLP